MERVSSFGQLHEIPILESFGEGVEQAADIPFFKRLVPGLPPLLEDGRATASDSTA
jgi:hypothetical protein